MRSLVVLAILARVALAQAPDLTKEFQAGVDAFRLGKLDEARAHLERAHKLDPKLPGPYRFLAAVSKAQAKWQECIDDARAALVLNPQSVEAPETRKLYDDCRVSAGKAPYRGELADSAAIAVTSNVPAATVKIGGLIMGGTPMAPRPITAGKLEIDVEKLGWKTKHLEVDAPAGIVTDVDAELDPDTTATTVQVQTPESKPTKGWLVIGTERIEMEPGTHVVERSAPGADLWRRRVRISAGVDTVVTPQFVNTEQREGKEHVGLAILGGSGLLLAGGFAFALASEHAANDAREIQRVEAARDPTQPISVTGAVEPVHTRADWSAAVDRANRDAIYSNVMYGAAIAGIGVATVFLVIGAKERTDIAPPFYVAPAAGGATVGKAVAW